ncbi:flippase [Halobacillus litoralis]|uniref:flippase n=1 Tax=Halobacillus litoralis TaxID=45668 RepID=UPI001CFCA59F|nr:flippase [Halobacillus litoralis]WLR49055.1 flippase [Halobacillus litoralis]
MKINSIKSGSLWSMLGQIVNLILGFLLLIFTTRFLGPDQYGLFQTMLTLVVLSVMVSDFGFSSSVARYVALHQNSLNRRSIYISNGIFIKLFATILVIVLLINTLPMLEDLLEVNLVGYETILIFITILRSFREFILKLMQGMRRLDLNAKFNIFYNIANTVLATLLLIMNFEIYSLLISEAILTFFFIMIFMIINKRSDLFSFQPLNKMVVKDILKYSLPMFFISMSFYLYMKSDTLMVQYYMNNTAVGLYSLATMIIGKVHMPLVAIGQATGPGLVALDKDERSTKLKKVIETTLLITIPICIGLYVISEELVLLFFGDEFYQTIKILQLMCFFLFFYSVNSVLSPTLDYIGLAKVRAVMVGVSATINLILNILFIPEFGIHGAVYSTLITYTAYSLLIIFTILKNVIYSSEYQPLFTFFVKTTIISYLMGYLVSFITKFVYDEVYVLVTSILTGIIIYLILGFIFKIINKTDINYLFSK